MPESPRYKVMVPLAPRVMPVSVSGKPVESSRASNWKSPSLTPAIQVARPLLELLVVSPSRFLSVRLQVVTSRSVPPNVALPPLPR